MTPNGADDPGVLACGLAALKKYWEFSGRARRKEYWGFQLIVYLPILAILVVGAAMDNTPIAMLPLAILAMMPAALGVAIRRLHDTGCSGWWLLLGFVPFGGLVLLVFYCTEGEIGANEYGDDPKSHLHPTFPGTSLGIETRSIVVEPLANRKVKSLDGAITIYSDRDLHSPVMASPSAGTEIQLGDSSELDGREWVRATLPSGEGGYALGPNIRSHSTFLE